MSGAHIKRAPYAGCPGKFDFAYNRIDFNKNQSVGYGFVNFISATWLLVFVKACRGMLLNHNVLRRHMKPCAVSYADVQGYECLASTYCRGWLLVLVMPAAANVSPPPDHLVDTPRPQG